MSTDLLTRSVTFEPTREAGLARLEEFVPFAGSTYRNERNYDFGPDNRANVSALSPWVRHRLVTEEEICARVLQDFALSSTEKFIQEVMWRTYWKGWLELRPSAWAMYEADLHTALEVAEANGAIRRDYNAAVEGNTGIDCFDAWAKELVETGYLHNHARMWFASIWIFTLQLNWTLGADFFYRNLMDADPASNTLSWKWVAGLQTLGKNYVARASNIRKFSDGRFNPKGLNENAQALPGEPHGKPDMMQPMRPLPTGKKAYLLFTEDDCRAEELNFQRNTIVGAGGWDLSTERSPIVTGDVAKSFISGAVEDARKRVSAFFDVTTNAVEGADALEEVVVDVTKSGAEIVIAPYTPVGHARQQIMKLANALSQERMEFFEVRRDWDTRAWPNSTKGFFPFKEKIPNLLLDAGFDIKGKQRRVA
ncbi:MAG: FAD-binding domain-containing protein [Pseudomonadota bacterium]